MTYDPRAAARRGSTLLLVLAALLLSMILGITYLEIVRLDRRATRNVLVERDMDYVIDSVEDLVRAKLLGDLGILPGLTPPQDQYFATGGDGDEDLNGDGNITPAEQAAAPEEPYDGPWDKDQWLAVSGLDLYVAPLPPQLPQPGPNPPLPGDVVFRQVTLLDPVKGFYNPVGVDKVRALKPLDARWDPRDPTKDNPHRMFDPADADGDGITDSKPMKAPIEALNGVNYMMWVRVIDNSSMLNLNTAMAIGNGLATAYDGNANPHGWSPSEINMARFAHEILGVTRQVDINIDLAATWQHRLDMARTLPLTAMPWGVAAQGERGHYWEMAGRYYEEEKDPAFTYRKYDVGENEPELRYRNGLNNGDHITPIEDPNQGMAYLFRTAPAGLPTEVGYQSVPGIYTGGVPNFAEYFAKEPRHQTTTISGSAIYRRDSDIPSGLAGTDRHQYDLNSSINLPGAAAGTFEPTDLGNEISRVLGAAYIPPTDTGMVREVYGAQLAASLLDAADLDGSPNSPNPTTVTPVAVLPTGGGGTRYGLESLPFITEVYVHHAYLVDVTTVAAPVQPPAPLPQIPSTSTYTWEKELPTGYAIELRNPFNTRISLRGVFLTIGGLNATPTPAQELSVIVSSVIPNKDFLDIGETLILYQDSSAESPRTLGNLVNGTVFNPLIPPVTAIPYATTAFDAGTPVEVELHVNANDAGPTDVVYQRVHVEEIVAQQTYIAAAAVFVPPRLPPGDGTYEFKQRSTIGNGNGLNALAFREDEFVTHVNYFPPSVVTVPPTLDEYPAPYTEIDKLGLANKTVDLLDPLDKGGPDDRIPSTPAQQIVVANLGRVVQAGEMAMVAIIGPSIDAAGVTKMTVPDAWNGRTTLDSLYLDLAGPPAPNTDPDALLRREQILMDQFTTLSPLVDVTAPGAHLNNDGDNVAGIDPDELFVPGKININTVTEGLLSWILPIPNAALSCDIIVGNLITYRDQGAAPGIRPVGHRTVPGFASAGEFFNVLTDPPGDTFQIESPATVDFHPSPPVADGVIDDVEERTLIARWLTQIASVRSDIFTAYILVRGYKEVPGVAEENWPPISEKRVLVVFDRSKITNANDRPKVIASFEY